VKTKIRDLLARQGIQVALLVIALEVITYWSYFMRLTVVNGDANAHYLSDSYYWWNNGGVFKPPPPGGSLPPGEGPGEPIHRRKHLRPDHHRDLAVSAGAHQLAQRHRGSQSVQPAHRQPGRRLTVGPDTTLETAQAQPSPPPPPQAKSVPD